VTDKIQNALYFDKLQPALRAYLTKLREEAYIKIQEGYADSGRSPNQTEPIETRRRQRNRRQESKKKKKKKFWLL